MGNHLPNSPTFQLLSGEWILTTQTNLSHWGHNNMSMSMGWYYYIYWSSVIFHGVIPTHHLLTFLEHGPFMGVRLTRLTAWLINRGALDISHNNHIHLHHFASTFRDLHPFTITYLHLDDWIWVCLNIWGPGIWWWSESFSHSQYSYICLGVNHPTIGIISISHFLIHSITLKWHNGWCLHQL
jgi:hypothetical protein